MEGMRELDYWDMLKVLHMFSHKNRREWFMIIFIWKISHGFIRGYVVTFTSSEPRGITIVPNKIVRSAPVPVRKARECFLGVKGAYLFNILPVTLKNFNPDIVESIKKKRLMSNKLGQYDMF